MYKAIITKIFTRPHPNADKLQIGVCAGSQVIVSKDVQDGQLGAYFPTDGEMSDKMCWHNNLYRKGKGQNKDSEANGYFEENRRIKCLTLRSAKSEGIWLELDKLAWTGIDLQTLKEGQVFDTLNGHLICEKYYSKATRRVMGSQKQNPPRVSEVPMFKKHKDTEQLRYYIGTIPTGARVIITRKLHGTSGRTGNLLVAQPLKFWQQKINDWLVWLGGTPIFIPEQKWMHVSGSRNVTFDPRIPLVETDYNDRAWRISIGQRFTLHKGETIYYEIVGYMGNTPIMTPHSLDKDKDEIRKSLEKLYPKRIVYSYGLGEGQYEIYVYRITNTNVDNITTELSWDQIKARCRELGLKHVPEVWADELTTRETLLDICKHHSDGPDPLDNRHPVEGVCVRVEHPDMYGTIFKDKGFVFKYLEGIAKEQDVVDMEEIS